MSNTDSILNPVNPVHTRYFMIHFNIIFHLRLSLSPYLLLYSTSNCNITHQKPVFQKPKTNNAINYSKIRYFLNNPSHSARGTARTTHLDDRFTSFTVKNKFDLLGAFPEAKKYLCSIPHTLSLRNASSKKLCSYG